MSAGTPPFLDAAQVLPRIYDDINNIIQIGAPASLPLSVNVLTDLIPTGYDSISISYNGSNIQTVQYFKGGLSGTLVATLTLGYTSGQLSSVVRT